LNETTAAMCGLFVTMVPLAAAGLALINAGLGRSRNAAQAMTAALCVFGIAGLASFVLGFGIQSHPGLSPAAIMIGGKPWSWIGRGPFFLRGLQFDGSAVPLAAWLQLSTLGLAALIPLGGGGGRWRLGSICVSTVLFSVVIFPLFAHWAWGGGWLAQLGANYGLGRGFIDTGGSGVIQCTGGLTALVVTWMLGPRRGKFGADGMPAAIPGHNVLVVLFGCMLAVVGWVCLNEAGGILYGSANLALVPLIAINTLLAAGSALLAAAAVTRLRFGKPDASLSANGLVAGLAASSASCLFVKPAEAVVVGLVAGVLVIYSIELFELRLGVDDPGGAVSVHGAAGLWGIFAMGLFGQFETAGQNQGQLVAQLIGIATLLGFVFPLSYGLNWLLNRVSPFRTDSEGEWQGLDLHELGAGAYPEFVSQGEEFTPR
jgi:Amt family ammonium transporter